MMFIISAVADKCGIFRKTIEYPHITWYNNHVICFQRMSKIRICLFWYVLLLLKEEKHERKTRLGEYFRAFFIENYSNNKNP